MLSAHAHARKMAFYHKTWHSRPLSPLAHFDSALLLLLLQLLFLLQLQLLLLLLLRLLLLLASFLVAYFRIVLCVYSTIFRIKTGPPVLINNSDSSVSFFKSYVRFMHSFELSNQSCNPHIHIFYRLEMGAGKLVAVFRIKKKCSIF